MTEMGGEAASGRDRAAAGTGSGAARAAPGGNASAAAVGFGATLSVESLSVEYVGIAVVREVSLSIAAGECLGVVGESGSGKTQLFLAVMGLLPPEAAVCGRVRFEGEDMLGQPPGRMNRIRGARAAMIFQDPSTSLTPHLRIGDQLAEMLVQHAGRSWRQARFAALRMLEHVGMPEPQRRAHQYPHELSGGLRQRAMIGMSLMCNPALLIADEPTTALDVRVQAQIVALLRSLRAEQDMALALISHDLAVVGQLADRIAVMYAGRIVECAPARRLWASARHPYTAALLECTPRLGGELRARMPTLVGQPPAPGDELPGCAFAPRCPRAQARCLAERPTLADGVACHYPLS